MCESFRFSLRSLHGIISRRKIAIPVPSFRLPTNKNMVTITSTITSTIERRKLAGYTVTTTTSPTTRLFGSKRGVPGNPSGTISIYNDQKALKDIDEDSIRNTVRKISKLVGYDSYDVTLL